MAQPFFDILSFMSIRNIIPFNISTYLKPLIVFSFGTYLLFQNRNRKGWYVYISMFIILLIGHTYLLHKLLISTSVILHEIRFLINIAYMIALIIITWAICKDYPDKDELLRKIKNSTMITFIIYFSLYLLAILTGTSSMTYEIADINKLGFKGWYDSGQILGHAFSIMFPVLIYVILTPKRPWYARLLILLLCVTSVSLLGTKVPYYIIIIVLIIYLVINLVIPIFNKEHKRNYFNIAIVSVILIALFATYRYTPVKYNTDLNNLVSNTNIDEYDLSKESGAITVKTHAELEKEYPGKDIEALLEYQNYDIKASNYLTQLFNKGKIHPSNMRFKQVSYAHKKFQVASLKYKIFGLGFLNQTESLALESDFFMALYSFGILGFILFLIIPIKEFIKMAIYIIRNIHKIDLETYMLYMSLGIFFCISIYAGYTYIYTNFSIFLVMIISMLKVKRTILKQQNLDDNKVSFLMLHLGYGGIETATINTANALCDKYNVEIISFYKLKKNQENRIDSRIKVKYLYPGEPNREKFKDCLKNKQLFKTIYQGIKAVSILLKKRIYVINAIINSDAKYLVSTRYDFSVLLSKYGSVSQTKIAAEHHYHNNNKKYINILKHKYYNIDYLLALTKTLEEDYHQFLKHNHHTKIVLMPNMLEEIPTKKSDLKSKNLITMSRLDYGKKNEDIIKAFAKLKNKDWTLTILGDGPEYNKLASLIKELKLSKRVKLVGYVSKEHLGEYLTKSSIFLMASLTEGLPMVLLEAMSYGLPCIAYETASGVNDIISNDKNGYVIKNRNELEYVKSIEKIVNNKQKLQEFSNNALETIDKFTKDKIIIKWYEILK